MNSLVSTVWPLQLPIQGQTFFSTVTHVPLGYFDNSDTVSFQPQILWYVSLTQRFSIGSNCPPHETFGNIWRYFLLSLLRGATGI